MTILYHNFYQIPRSHKHIHTKPHTFTVGLGMNNSKIRPNSQNWFPQKHKFASLTHISILRTTKRASLEQIDSLCVEFWYFWVGSPQRGVFKCLLCLRNQVSHKQTTRLLSLKPWFTVSLQTGVGTDRLTRKWSIKAFKDILTLITTDNCSWPVLFCKDVTVI